MSKQRLIAGLLRVGLYFISLFWLFVLLIICEFKPSSNIANFKYWFFDNLITTISLICLILCSVSYKVFCHISSYPRGRSRKILSIEDVNSEQLAFLATYILPLILYDYSNIRSVLNIFIIMAIVGFIFCKTNLFYANPTLATLGYKVYKVKLEGEEMQLYVVTRKSDKLHTNDSVYLSKLNDTTYYAYNCNNVKNGDVK